VLIRPKPGILDPQGEAVGGALRQLGFSVREARVGRVVDLELDGADPESARVQAEQMCRQLLANPLIETYEILLATPDEPATPEGNAPGHDHADP
jgi:phosphoribosylformylglycinamidine synthase